MIRIASESLTGCVPIAYCCDQIAYGRIAYGRIPYDRIAYGRIAYDLIAYGRIAYGRNPYGLASNGYACVSLSATVGICMPLKSQVFNKLTSKNRIHYTHIYMYMYVYIYIYTYIRP